MFRRPFSTNVLAAVGVAALVVPWVPVTAGDAAADDMQHNIARGGTLYDKWFEIADGMPGRGTHPAYGSRGTLKGRATWRCTACHGWDYKGKDGAYGSGSHYTGIAGIRGAAGKGVEAIIAVLKDDTHAYTDDMMGTKEFRDLALFVSLGQHDVDAYIDPGTGAAKGDKDKGAGYYNTICAKCHGLDGRKPKGMAETVGKMARDNPWAALHKVRNGEPGAQMPVLRALPMEISADVVAYAQTLPASR